MSLLNNLFGKNKQEPAVDAFWKTLVNSEQLEEIKKTSFEKPVAIFKHSTRCIISKMALKNFESDFSLHDVMDVYYLDLIAYRNISNKIADDFGITHQSPQILLIKDGVAVYAASHESIDANVLTKII